LEVFAQEKWFPLRFSEKGMALNLQNGEFLEPKGNYQKGSPLMKIISLSNPELEF